MALRSYQAELARPLNAHTQDGIDILILAAMFINLFAFVLPPEEDASPMAESMADTRMSWVFSTREDRLRWLSIQLGLKPLLLATRPWHDGTSLKPLFKASDDEKGTFSRKDGSMAGVPPSWLLVFGLQQDGDDIVSQAEAQMNRRLFREPLRLLAKIRRLEPSKNNMFRYLQFIGRLEPEFRDKLYVRDEKVDPVLGMSVERPCELNLVGPQCHRLLEVLC